MDNKATDKKEEPEFERGTRSLPLDSLTADWITNVRADPGDVTGLAESIRGVGLQMPIVVRPSPRSPGLYEIVEGSRRVAAYRHLAQEDPRFKKIEARVLRNCDDAHAVVCSFDENDKRGNLSARELGSYIEILQRNSPYDPGSKETTAWVAKQLGWFLDGKADKKGKKRSYPDVARVRKALEDAEFQKLVPNVEIKIRSRGDVDRPAVPLTVAREARQAILAVRQKLGIDPAVSQKVLEEFLLTYAKLAPPRFRKQFRTAFLVDPSKPIAMVLKEVQEEVSRPTLEQLVPLRLPSELTARVDEWLHAAGHGSWTRPDAYRDLLERGLQTIAGT